jgi:hypothetical protein
VQEDQNIDLNDLVFSQPRYYSDCFVIIIVIMTPPGKIEVPDQSDIIPSTTLQEKEA